MARTHHELKESEYGNRLVHQEPEVRTNPIIDWLCNTSTRTLRRKGISEKLELEWTTALAAGRPPEGFSTSEEFFKHVTSLKGESNG